MVPKRQTDRRTDDLSPAHTGDYSRRFRRLSPKTATVAEFGDYSRQCGQAITVA